MIQKSLALLLAGFVLGVVGNAQTPAPAPEPDKPEARTFSFSFDGDGGYLGIQTEEVTKDNFAKLGLREVRGIAVEKVVPGSPAERAGVKAGDVIVRFDNEEVTSVRKLTRLLNEVSADHQVRLTVIRAGGERELTATVGKRPMPKFGEGNFAWSTPPGPGEFQIDPPDVPNMNDFPQIAPGEPGAPDRPFMFRMGSGRKIGVGVTSLTKQLSEHFGVDGGVMINEVRADSPAAKAGLKAGDIIVEAEGKDINSEVDLIRVLQEKKEGDVSLTFVRGGNRQTIRVTPEKGADGGFQMFDVPATPDAPTMQQFKLATPATPLPMNEFKFPGRIL